MKTIALRFSDNFAPQKGTIYYHQEMIDKFGYVWYGKFGNTVSKKVCNEILNSKNPKFLLIKSGGIERYWAYVKEIQNNNIDKEKIPEYYRNNTNNIKTWFKIIKIERADNDIMSKCFISSTGQVLSLASKYSMTPYFIINYKEESND